MKRSQFILLFVLASCAYSAAFAASGRITGYIFDTQYNEPLPGANVYLDGTTLGSSSDLNGKYLIPQVPAGSYKLVVKYIGYQEKRIDITITDDQELKQIVTLDFETMEGEVIEVTAQAEGQMQAINQQLASDKIANIVSEQRIQQLPDFNAAAALGRLPGVSTQKSSGEDNKVVIRGLSPKYNSIEVEGVKLSATGSSQIGLSSNPGAGNSSLDNDRSVDLTMVSPYMIRTIAVYKSLTPDMNANSIGGTVNMELREAPSDPHFDLLWQQGYTAKSNTLGNYRAVASGSNRFFDDTFGVYALINAESYDRNADNLNAGWNIPSSDIDSTTGYRPVEVSSVSFNRHLETRNRYGANLILDYNLPKGSVKFINMFARINSDYTNHDQTINYETGELRWNLREAENNTDQQMHSIKLDYDLGFLTADISASYTSARNQMEDSPSISFNQTGGVKGGEPRPNQKPEDLPYLINYLQDSSVVLRGANLFSNDYQEEKFTYKANFEVPFNIGTAASGFFKFGGQMYNQTNSTDQETPYLSFNGNANGDGTDIQSNLMRAVKNEFGISTDRAGNLTGDNFINGDSDLFKSFLNDRFGDIYYVSNPRRLVDILNYIIGNPDFDASNSAFGSDGNDGGWYDGPYQQLTNDYEYNEDYYAAYAMSRINWMDFMLIGGVRYEKVHSEYFAYNARDMRNAQSQIMYDTTSVSENDFVLPMGQIKYSPFQWMDVRYAYTHTLARPDYNALSPKFTITQDNRIYAGNPALKPAKAFNHDLSFTFHSNKLGLLTVGVFYKTIENFVYRPNYQLNAAQNAGVDSIANYTIMRNGQAVITPQANATVYRSINNPFDATVKGIELDFQHNFWYAPAPFNSLVFGVNYAGIASKAKYPFYITEVIPLSRPIAYILTDSSFTGRLIDQPNHVLNSYIGFDYKGFSSRLSVIYQAFSRTSAGQEEFPEDDTDSKDYLRIDFSARQKLPFYNSELFLDVNNLNSENNRSVIKSTGGYRNIQNYGLTANFGIRIRY